VSAKVPARPVARYGQEMPTDPPLTDDEQAVLRALMAPESRPANSTVEILAERTGLGDRTGRVLRGLARRDPPLAMRLIDEGLGVQFWISTYDAADALDPPPDI
jgi:hypothetical protein